MISSSRTRLGFFCGLCLALAVTWVAFNVGENAAYSEAKQDVHFPQPVDWNKLTDQLTEEGEGVEIESVELQFRKNKAMALKYGAEHDVQAFSYTSKAADTRKILQLVCSETDYWPLRLAQADDSRTGGGWGAGSKLGVLTIRFANGEHVDVSITMVGFTLGTAPPTFRTQFFSTLLALEVDKLYLAKTGRHLPAELIDTLSGAERMRRERSTFYKLSRQSLDETKTPQDE